MLFSLCTTTVMWVQEARRAACEWTFSHRIMAFLGSRALLHFYFSSRAPVCSTAESTLIHRNASQQQQIAVTFAWNIHGPQWGPHKGLYYISFWKHSGLGESRRPKQSFLGVYVLNVVSVLPLHRSQSTWRRVRVQTVWPPWRISRSSTALWPSSSAITSLARTPSSSPGHPSRASAFSPNSANKVDGAAVLRACVGHVALIHHLFVLDLPAPPASSTLISCPHFLLWCRD